MKWIDSIPPFAPQNLNITYSDEGALLKWKEPETTEEVDGASYYVVYRFMKNEIINTASAINIVAVVRQSVYFAKGKNQENFQYVVTAVDRLHNESIEYAMEH